MRMGVHKARLANSLQRADEICLYQPAGLNWNIDDVVAGSDKPAKIFSSTEEIVRYLSSHSAKGDHILIMSNGGFEGIHQRLLDALALKE
jgi:UDP-N-acetylmuramate: L-alanyl-gamma-D-glutamyl-meso-diaminopimelate ligase